MWLESGDIHNHMEDRQIRMGDCDDWSQNFKHFVRPPNQLFKNGSAELVIKHRTASQLRSLEFKKCDVLKHLSRKTLLSIST